MNDELSPQARSLLARAKRASSPSSDDEAKVLASLAATLPSGASAAGAAKIGASTGAGASGIAPLSAVKLLIICVAAVGTGVVGTIVVRHQASPPQATTLATGSSIPSQSAEPPPLPATVVPVSAPVESAPEAKGPPEARPTALQPPVRARPVAEVTTPRTSTRASGAATVDRCDLSAELSSLRQAQALLTSAPAEALNVLEGWQRDCAHGSLFEERLAVRALAMCSLPTRHEAGRALLLELRTRFPASPSIERVARQCAGP
jgi:hypothetical protein